MNLIYYFHARISGGRNVDSGVSIDPAFGQNLFRRQMLMFHSNDLIQNCTRFVIGLNGDSKDKEFVERFIDSKWPIELVWHGPESESLLPTMGLLQRELKPGSNALIGFGHTKGVTQPGSSLYHNWRECMMDNTVTHWRRCVMDLMSGNYDAVGCHWTANSAQDQNAHDWGANSYFAGVFWWATSRYLLTLPNLPEKPHNRHQWFKPELWLGNGKPRVKDYHEGSVMVHA
jgi:hypothetical protein